MSPSCLQELPTPSSTVLKLSSTLPSHLSLVPPPSQMSSGVFLPPFSIPTLPAAPVSLEPLSQKGEILNVGLCSFLTANSKCQSWMDSRDHVFHLLLEEGD